MWQRNANNSNHALTLKLEAYGDDTPASSSHEESNRGSDLEDDKESTKQCSSRKRKRSSEKENDEDSEESENAESDMPEVVHQMEAEIERQLDNKAKKSNLTVANVKNIIKSVITNEHVLELVRHTMQQPESNVCINTVFSFTPKLTRSKTKELLNTFPSMAWPLTPSKNVTNPECKVFIEEELPEDSSDEEYHPEDDQEDDTDYLKSESDIFIDGEDDDEEDEEEEESDDIEHYDDEDEEEEEVAEDEHNGDMGKCNDSEKECSGNTSLNSDASKEDSALNSNVNRGNDEDDDDDDDDCRLVICDTENDVIEDSECHENVNSTTSPKPSEKAFIDNPETVLLKESVEGEEEVRLNVNSVLDEPVNTEGNICQRTRSKLCLSDTPLEIIESAFMPPDITTDMYDLECDDENWKNFLKRFTEPLKLNIQGAPDDEDDEEMDPEYNVMAEDEETEDKEELREDPEVMVSHTEVHALMAELFEYSGMLFEDTESKKKSNKTNGHVFQSKSMDDELDDIAEQIAGALDQHAEETKLDKSQAQMCRSEKSQSFTHSAHPPLPPENETSSSSSVPSTKNIHKTDNILPDSSTIPFKMSTDQKLLLGQQLRKHIQLLTQHYLLAFLHPVYHVHAMDCKQYLTFLKLLTQNDKNSTYYVENLDESLALVEKWELMHSSEESKEKYVRFIENELESYSYMKKKRHSYKGKFPPELCEVIVNSSVFLYPSLLPVAPFRCDSRGTPAFFPSEDSLIALGLELFKRMAKENPKVWGNGTLYKMVPLVIEHFTPVRKASTVYNHILDCAKKGVDNPIKYYLVNGCAPKTIHYVIPYVILKPPIGMPHELLPDIWKNYLCSKNEENT